MNTPGSQHRFHVLLACWALAWAVCCGDRLSDHCTLSLPRQGVSVPEGQEHRARFRVESHDGAFSTRATFVPTPGSHPDLEGRYVGPENGLGGFRGTNDALGDAGTEWYGRAILRCGDAFPCAADFEVIVSGAAVEGTLSVEVRASNRFVNPDGAYLAVEPL
ncbi:MAG: hypothetical protein ACOC1F_00435 [Myxococcota bacterium]